MINQPVSQEHPSGTRRYRLLMMTSIVIVGALGIIHIGVGSVPIHPPDVIAVIIGQPNDALHQTIVWDLRMPRALIALTAGAMLGLAGAMLQSITQNPLASPALTGVLSGTVLAAVFWTIAGPGHLQNGPVLPLVATAGGLATSALVYGLSWRGGTTPLRLVLAGVLVGAMLTSVTSLVLLIDQTNMGNILHWLIGSLNGRVWSHWHILAPFALITLPLGLASAALANALQLGDGVAVGLGLRVEPIRAFLLLVAVLLVAGAVAIVGSIAFIGLIAPHIARSLVGGDHRRLFPFTAIFAGGLLLLADIIARIVTLLITSPGGAGAPNLPVGAVTAMLGALFFLYLMLRKEV